MLFGKRLTRIIRHADKTVTLYVEHYFFGIMYRRKKIKLTENEYSEFIKNKFRL